MIEISISKKDMMKDENVTAQPQPQQPVQPQVPVQPVQSVVQPQVSQVPDFKMAPEEKADVNPFATTVKYDINRNGVEPSVMPAAVTVAEPAAIPEQPAPMQQLTVGAPDDIVIKVGGNKKNLKKPLIIGGIIAVVALIAVVMTVVIMAQGKTKKTTPVSQNTVVVPEVTCGDDTDFAKMEKEEAMACVKEAAENRGFNVERLTDDENLLLDKDENRLYLLYSYDDADEVKKIADESIMKYDFTDETGYELISNIYYTVVVEDKTLTKCGENCIRGIAFNKKYLNYGEETIVEEIVEQNEEGEEVRSERTHTEEVLKLANTREAVAEMVMPILAAMQEASCMYRYELTEVDGNYVLTTYAMGVGIDYNAQSYGGTVVPYAINLYTMTTTVNIETGEITRQRNSDDSGYMEVVRSISLSDEDMTEIYGDSFAAAVDDATAEN